MVATIHSWEMVITELPMDSCRVKSFIDLLGGMTRIMMICGDQETDSMDMADMTTILMMAIIHITTEATTTSTTVAIMVVMARKDTGMADTEDMAMMDMGPTEIDTVGVIPTTDPFNL